MSRFEPSARNSKRRKLATNGAGSTKSKVFSSPHRNVPDAASSISQRLFEPADSEDELMQGHLSPNVQDSAYVSKEDALIEDDLISLGTAPAVEQSAQASESADELAHSEVTVTPTKSQGNGVKTKQKTTGSGEGAVLARSDVEGSQNSPAQTRSSGRERKRPRWLSASLEDTLKPTLPRGIMTPSRKFNKAPWKTVASDQETEGGLGFRDLKKSASKNIQQPISREKSFRSNKAHDEAKEDAHQALQGAMDGEKQEAALFEEQPIPDVPELPELKATSLLDSSLVPADSQLDPVKSLVLSRLSGQGFTPLINLEVEYSKLHSLLSATIKAGEGNSILLLGSRGVGKTCLVETVIADLETEYAEDFHVIRLNGFFQTDDKLALREIWRQLGREMRVEEDETAQVITYADTMASLLHLLSHPEELAETLEPDAPSRTTKSVMFVLDEFDLFTIHPRQTLLYNLFDIAQSRKAPIAVIGCTARVDISDNLEKRVKSRFSHRWIHLSQAKSPSAFEDIARAALLLRETQNHHAGQGISKKIRMDWNAFIEKVFLPSSHVQDLLSQCFHTTKSIPDLFSSLYIEIATIDSIDQTTLSQAIPTCLQPPDSVLNMLTYLPLLHLSLLISAARLDAIYNATVVTFSLVYNHYAELVSRARLQASAAGSIAHSTKLWNRDIAVGAWQDLVEWEIILPAGSKGAEGGQTKMWRCDVVLEEITGAVGGGDAGMNDVLIRWCKEI